MPAQQPAVLFVCLGNICRSPTAEAVFRHKARQRGMTLTIDSAGTAGYHVGSPPDARSREVGEQRGYDFSGVQCRRVDPNDFEVFDYIIAMDHSNREDLLAACPEHLHHKVDLFLAFTGDADAEVPDPYYGGQRGFEYVLDLIEQASEGLLDRIQAQQ
ncbi:low molecular weight phosphotyrosine protein phosphatase [Aestuariibacter halophilus]|uniref:protein-tyrosine-phosphatase n=1 Tax=Fluctibacter halophilus TaxID=226011 RepID=A0ABS8G6B0_9ALTE|nr:low molecular weight protein-tyrosine-phosphatase [Aestuariibacter halophilus]MCC2616075.1 low molecular weight phosphotyrosine protein phosphatase [Aestuariibacter halophilus]